MNIESPSNQSTDIPRINNVSPSVTEYELIKLRADKAELLAALKQIADGKWSHAKWSQEIAARAIAKIEDK